MKSLITSLVLLAFFTNAFADTSSPSKHLVEQYLEEVKAEEQIAAEVQGYTKQFTANASPEAKSQMEQYLNATIGWKVVKDQYVSLIQKIYTEDELKAALVFFRSPEGSSMTQKNPRFAQELATLIATNIQKIKQTPSSSQANTDNADSVPATAVELIALGVEEQNVDGRVYFIGSIENRGNRPARAVQVEVNLFLAGKFVDQYSTYVSGSVMPGTPRYFKVICGCKDSLPAKHDSFKVYVVEGY